MLLVSTSVGCEFCFLGNASLICGSCNVYSESQNTVLTSGPDSLRYCLEWGEEDWKAGGRLGHSCTRFHQLGDNKDILSGIGGGGSPLCSP